MNQLRGLFKRIAILTSTLAIWAAWAEPVLAQAKDEANQAKSASWTVWVIPYALVLLGIGLGLMVVCRMGKRQKSIRQLPD